MKKTILFFLLAITSKSITGQVSVGLTVGNNLCTVKQTVDYESNPNLIKPDENEYLFANGFTIGIPLEIKISDRLNLFTVVSYMQKGTKLETTMDMSDNVIAKYSGTTKFNYLELPIQGKYYFVKKKLNAYVSLGPSFGYLLNAKAKYKITTIDKGQDITSTDNFDQNIKSKDLKDAGVNRLDISIALGTGVDFEVWRGKLFVNVNYIHGLSDKINSDEEINQGIKQLNRGLSTTLGYLIPLSK